MRACLARPKGLESFRNLINTEGDLLMHKNRINSKLVIVALAVLFILALVWTGSSAQQPTVTGTVLLQQDLNIPGSTVALVSVEIPVGGREGKHTHPGTLVVYVRRVTVTLDYGG